MPYTYYVLQGYCVAKNGKRYQSGEINNGTSGRLT